MHSPSHIPTYYPNADVQVFVGNSDNVSYRSDYIWTKPPGKSMGHILLVGNGGRGGSGLIGANSLAGGGGGGGSGGQTSITFPLCAVPDILCIGVWGTNSSNASYVALTHTGTIVGNNTFISANPGGSGGNGTATPAGGTAGTGASAAAAASMCLGQQWLDSAVAGQAGGVGGTTGNGVTVGLPTTGLFVTAGTGGGGLVAAATSGELANGGLRLGVGIFPQQGTELGGQTATTPSGRGSDGYSPIIGLPYWYGGTGGGSTHGSATGAGAVQAPGGNGAWGCGGGGSGAALTGSVAGSVGKGGPAFCIITCW